MSYNFSDSSSYSYTAGAKSSLFLGACPETGEEVGITTERHLITIAGARSGKGATLIHQNLVRWPHAVICIDPKGENTSQTWEARRNMGQTVAALDPFHVTKVPDDVRACFNPLAEIDPYARRSREKVLALADGMVVVHDPKHMEWVDGARAIIAGAIAFTIATAEPEVRTLSTVRELLKLPPEEMAPIARAMMDCRACGGLASAGGGLILSALQSKGGLAPQLLPKAKAATDWLDSPEIADCLSSSSFDLSDLKNDSLTLYLVLQPDDIRTYSAFFRMFVRAALKIMMTDEPEQDHRCLFLLDEFHSLGKMDTIAEAAGLMAGYGVTLWPFMQDLGQLRELYGNNGAETFFGNADAEIYFNNKDTLTLGRISEKLEKTKPNEIESNPPGQKPFIESPFRKWKWPYIIMSKEDGRVRHELEQRNLKEIHRVKHGISQSQYDHNLRSAGAARMTPSEIEAMIGKGNGDKVARSAIVFAKAGDVLKVTLWPWFVPENPALKPALENKFKNYYDDMDAYHALKARENDLGALARYLAPKMDISEQKFKLYYRAAFWGLFAFAVITGIVPHGIWSIIENLLPQPLSEQSIFNFPRVQVLTILWFYCVVIVIITDIYVEKMDYKFRSKIEERYFSFEMSKEALDLLIKYRMKRYPKRPFIEELFYMIKSRSRWPKSYT